MIITWESRRDQMLSRPYRQVDYRGFEVLADKGRRGKTNEPWQGLEENRLRVGDRWRLHRVEIKTEYREESGDKSSDWLEAGYRQVSRNWAGISGSLDREHLRGIKTMPGSWGQNKPARLQLSHPAEQSHWWKLEWGREAEGDLGRRQVKCPQQVWSETQQQWQEYMYMIWGRLRWTVAMVNGPLKCK